ncbi:serine/threonine-protein kinase [Streptomyces sp. NPDC093065]|uniref:serine/threonine-protein kinase n=1 Tax=Streptomyces sp. NPDC093065 TaxID=3366021 RepID=UPI0037F2A623
MLSSDRIGRYRLDRRLGTGAFGTVWLAHDDQLQAPVAVKVLAENWSERLDVRERFLSEARMLRKVRSAHVVQVYDIGELPDGRPYFVMEYGDDGTLDDLADGSLGLPEVLRLTALAARGAAALHQAGVVHRDIKPSNILLATAPDGSRRVLLADLGLAKSLAHASGLTLAAGSAGYQPPEQAQPGSGVDERADVYALGAVAYRLLTGTVPATPGQVVPVDRLRPGLPPRVSHAVTRALEPEREHRWPTAERLAEELESTGERPGPGASRRPRVRAGRRTLLLAVGAVVLAGAVAVTTLLLDRGSGSDSGVSVSDDTGRLTVRVPVAWAGQKQTGGWNPSELGLRPGHEPGLTVADDLSAWADPDTGASGVFVGLGGQEDVTAKVNGIAHDGCRYTGAHAFDGARSTGRVRTWADCFHEGETLVEAALGPADGGDRPEAYVQIRLRGTYTDVTRVLDSVRVGT